MILVKPSFEIWTPEVSISSALIMLEKAGRVCYKSESKDDWEVTKRFIRHLIEMNHLSVIEHFNITVKFIVDRGVTHELVRHRLASYSQESTRYCNYKGGVTFVIPPWVIISPGEYSQGFRVTTIYPDDGWTVAMLDAERHYLWLLNKGWSPQQARSVLPNSLKTEIVVTANLREWRHIFKLRTSKAAHPQMREIMIPLLKEFQKFIPVVFDDIEVEGQKDDR